MLFRSDELHGSGAVKVEPVNFIAAKTELDAAFAHLSEELATECWRDYEHKLRRWEEQREIIAGFIREWPTYRTELRELVRPPSVIAQGLVVAGSAATFAELDPSVDEDLAFWAVRNCAMMRNRLTAVDMLTLLGFWDDEAAVRVIAKATAFAGVGDRR